MKNTIYVGSNEHPVLPVIKQWIESCEVKDIEVVFSIDEISTGSILFLVACPDIIPRSIKAKYEHCLVVHASNLPQGRGWSPHVWDIIHGANEIYLSILEAEDKVDTGDIWFKEKIPVPPHFLYNEINDRLFNSVVKGIDWSIKNSHKVIKEKQDNKKDISYYPKRTPEDSRLDIDMSIREQFNKLRICDTERYPAFIEHLGFKYKITISKID